MNRRFFADQKLEIGEFCELTGPEAHHLSRVLRAQIGDGVTLFDGSGGEYAATIEAIKRNQVRLRVESCDRPDREPLCRVMLGVALPKGDRQRWLVEKLVEVGATSLTPLRTARGVAQPKGSGIDRLKRAVIEASKQCGRNHLMEIRPPMTADAFFEEAAEDASSTRWIAHPGEPIPASASDAASTCWLAVGPEGGFVDEEIEAARERGWRAVGLGPRILRVETAALALACKWCF